MSEETAADESQAPLGHNMPPSDAALLEESLNDESTEMLAKANELNKAIKRVPEDLVDDEQAEKVTIFVSQCNAWLKAIEEKRAEKKKPYDNLGKIVQTFYKGIDARVQAAKAVALGRLDVYTQKKEAAAEAEAAELHRKAAEKATEALTTGSIAAAQEAEQAEAEAVKVQETGGRVDTSYGQVASTRKKWEVEVTDIAAFVKAAAKGDVPLEWIEVDEAAIRKAAVDKVIDEKTDIPGVRVWQSKSTTVRG